MSESILDIDFTVDWGLVEVEKEIVSAVDDMLVFLFFIFIFIGITIYIYCVYVVEYIVELFLFIYIIPYLYIFLFFLPVVVLCEFGYYFISYLRGNAISGCFTSEFVFDHIAIFAFYVRTFIQNVRIFIIMLVIFGVHDLIIFSPDIFVCYNYSVIWTNLWTANFSLSTLVEVIWVSIHYILELIHSYFTFIVQCIAYFAMIFWLFSFLYLTFSLEYCEIYLNSLRKKYTQKNQNLTFF